MIRDLCVKKYLVFSLSVLWLVCLFSSPLSAAVEEGNSVIAIDPEASPPLRHEETLKFSWGAKLNANVRLRDNRDLRDDNDDRDIRTVGSLTLSGLYLSEARVLQPRFEFFGELQLVREVRHREGRGKTEDEIELKIRQGHLIWRNFIHPTLRLQIGRQRFKDKREWIYDEKLDAVRLFYEKDRLELQFSYSSNILDPEDSEDKVKNLIFYGIYPIWKKDMLAAYIVDRRGDDPYFHLTSMGVSLNGKSLKNQRYWLEAASVFGSEKAKTVRGYGFDLGWITRFKTPFRPAVTVGYAFGSGDSNPDDQKDKNFRQTGLQDNQSKLRGVAKVKQYGELFEPELSNLMVGTLGFGFRPVKKSSIDIVYHHYQQIWIYEEGNNDLRDVGIKEDPNGKSRHLGDEIDLIAGWKATRNLKLELIAAFFIPGPAFSGTDNAFLGKIKMSFIL